MKKVDLVYFHIEGPENSLELKYALRSIEKNFQNKNFQIHLIGEKPNWMSDKVNHIPIKRISGRDYTVYMDVIQKFKLTCGLPEIGEDFYRMMDDIYFINPVQKSDLDKLLAMEDFAGVDMKTRNFNASNKWANLMRKTIEVLRFEKKPQISYAHHLPQKFNKRNLIRLFQKFNIPANIYLIGTLYNNYFLRKKPDYFLLPKGAGLKLGIYTAHYKAKDLHHLRGENLYLNHSTVAWNAEMKHFLNNLFPEKSSFEL